MNDTDTIEPASDWLGSNRNVCTYAFHGAAVLHFQAPESVLALLKVGTHILLKA